MSWSELRVFGAREHNLRSIDATIPRHTLTVLTGVSGSGKSSLAFDTIYAEGQRRYVESLSSYARQFLDQMPRPHVEHIEGLSPAISIEQKTTGRNPRSTVGTVTEVYDFLRLLYAYVGAAHCPICNQPLVRQTAADIVTQVEALPHGSRVMILAPIVRGRKGEYRDVIEAALKEGYERAKIDGELVLLEPGRKLARHKNHDISLIVDRVIVGRTERDRLRQSIDTALSKAEKLVTVETMPGSDGKFPANIPWEGERTFSEAIGCPEHGPQIIELTPRMFSFNSGHGACAKCQGIGTITVLAPERLVPNEELAIDEGAIAPWAWLFKKKRSNAPAKESPQAARIRALLKKLGVPIDVPWKDIPPGPKNLLLHGAPKASVWEGLVNRLRRQLEETEDEDVARIFAQYLDDEICPSCAGARLKKESLAVSLKGLNIAQLCDLHIREIPAYLESIVLTDRTREIAKQPIREITGRLKFLEDVGLGYLTLSRSMATLSGGEAQRVRLATQIGSRLTGVLYILDEPSIGLHQRDNQRLIDSLLRLRDLGNTVLVVEHDEQTIRASDFVLDLGPGAGRLGGDLVASGSPSEIEANKASITGRFLAGTESISPPKKYRVPGPKRLTISGCTMHNLKDVTLDLPLGLMIGMSGVSGAGKSSLVIETLLPLLMQHAYHVRAKPGPHRAVQGLEFVDKVIHVDQAPIGRTPRSNPATYTKSFDVIRTLFASTEEARLRGYGPGRFSFNVEGGRCSECSGQGMRKVVMNFLPDVYVECESCHGARYNAETLEVKYRDKNIAEVLAMTIEDACPYFEGAPQISRMISTLRDVGLGYLTLGQPATTLSGGEAQRVKLSRELAKRNTGKTVYVLDEPTTGLHFEDVRTLIGVLQKLVDSGSTVIVIEHNLDVLKCCDWLIDVGPEGGAAGGTIVAQGAPPVVAKCAASHTGRFLKQLLKA